LFDNAEFQSVANEFMGKLTAGKTTMAKIHKFMKLMLNEKGELKMKDLQAYFGNIAADTLLKKDQLERIVDRLEVASFKFAVEKIKTYGVMNYTME